MNEKEWTDKKIEESPQSEQEHTGINQQLILDQRILAGSVLRAAITFVEKGILQLDMLGAEIDSDLALAEMQAAIALAATLAKELSPKNFVPDEVRRQRRARRAALSGVKSRTRKNTTGGIMNKNDCPNFDAFQGQPMVVPFIFQDGHVGPLEGKCRGFGAICSHGTKHEETIGVYTTDGAYHNIRVDLRITCAIPTFMIGETEFHYPVVACSTIGCKVDPATGIMI